jgi:hypothetical protein
MEGQPLKLQKMVLKLINLLTSKNIKLRVTPQSPIMGATVAPLPFLQKTINFPKSNIQTNKKSNHGY